MPVSITRAVVPAAGLGTRMRPLSYACPKELLPLGDRPVIHHILDELAQAGIREACVVVHPRKRAITEYLAAIEPPLSVQTVDQPEQRGLAHAVTCARSFTDGRPFLVALGDAVIDSEEPELPACRLLRQHEQTGDACILAQEVPWPDVARYGVMAPEGRPGEAFLLRDVVEKPAVDEAPSNLVISARYVLRPEVFDAIAATPAGRGGEVWLPDVFRRLMAQGDRFWGVRLHPGERRWDIGSLPTYFEAFARYVERFSSV